MKVSLDGMMDSRYHTHSELGVGGVNRGPLLMKLMEGEVMTAGLQLIKRHPDSQSRTDSTTQFLVSQKLQGGVSVGLRALQLSPRQGDRVVSREVEREEIFVERWT